MDPSDIATIVATVLSVIAFFLSVIAFARENAYIELEFYQMIDERERYMMSLDPNEEKDSEKYYHSCISIANAYEAICTQYLKFRIPRTTFNFMYKDAIIKIVESDTFKDIYEYNQTLLLNKNDIQKLPFPNTMKVYKKFKMGS